MTRTSDAYGRPKRRRRAVKPETIRVYPEQNSIDLIVEKSEPKTGIEPWEVALLFFAAFTLFYATYELLANR